MSDNWTLVICRTPPSANILLRQHWAVRQRLLDDWAWLIKAKCNELHVEPMEKCHLSATIYYSTNRKRDADNAEYGLKKITQDCLTRIGIIPDDNPAVLTWGAVTLAVDKDHPRTEVTLTPTL